MALRSKTRKPSTGDTAAVVRRKLKASATRINPDQAVTRVTYDSDKANIQVKGKSVYIPRKREPNEAMPPSADLFRRPNYKTGDGDTPQFRRIGSDHSHLKSFGNLT